MHQLLVFADVRGVGPSHPQITAGHGIEVVNLPLPRRSGVRHWRIAQGLLDRCFEAIFAEDTVSDGPPLLLIRGAVFTLFHAVLWALNAARASEFAGASAFVFSNFRLESIDNIAQAPKLPHFLGLIAS